MIRSKKITLSFAVLIINLSLIKLNKLQVSTIEIIVINVFLFSLFLFSDVLQKRLIKIKKAASTVLLSINFLRSLMCLLFLIPIILNYQKSDNIYIYNFFICYFFYLFYDLILQSKKQIK